MDWKKQLIYVMSNTFAMVHFQDAIFQKSSILMMSGDVKKMHLKIASFCLMMKNMLTVQ